MICVQICYAEPQNQILITLHVPENTHIADAIQQSGIAEKLPIKIQEENIGIFGKKQTFNTLLKEHDRIEIYRHLIATPQEIRKNRLHHSAKE